MCEWSIIVKRELDTPELKNKFDMIKEGFKKEIAKIFGVNG